MSAIVKLLKEGWLVFGILAFGFAPMPMANTPLHTTTAPIISPPPMQKSTDRLQQAWERE
jgi:hypothetical protein